MCLGVVKVLWKWCDAEVKVLSRQWPVVRRQWEGGGKVVGKRWEGG